MGEDDAGRWREAGRREGGGLKGTRRVEPTACRFPGATSDVVLTQPEIAFGVW